MFEVSDEEFESMMECAIDSIPDEFLNDLDNVYFTFEEGVRRGDGGSLVLGLYHGIPLESRTFTSYGAYDVVPDKITLYKGSIQRVCDTCEEVAEQVRKTVIHEVAHYFGMDEDQVRDMGY